MFKDSLLSPAQKQGMTAYNAAGNQQKAMYGSGKIPQSMKAAAAYGGGWSPAYDSVLNTTRNAWANWKPAATEQEYQKRLNSSAKPSNLTKAPPKKQPQGSPDSGSGYTGQSTIRPPNYIADSVTEDAAQNVLAQGYAAGDHRYQTKNLARPGFSQGKGQEFAGARKAAEEMNKAAGQAADIRSQDQLANSRMQSDYQKASELEAQQNAMLQHTLGQSDWARDFAKKSIDAQTQMAYLQAMLQLKLSLMR